MRRRHFLAFIDVRWAGIAALEQSATRVSPPREFDNLRRNQQQLLRDGLIDACTIGFKKGCGGVERSPERGRPRSEGMRYHAQRYQRRPASLLAIGRDNAAKGPINEIGTRVARRILYQVQYVFDGARQASVIARCADNNTVASTNRVNEC